MTSYYINEKTREIINELEYDHLTAEEQEEYLYLGMRGTNPRWEKDLQMPKPYKGKRVRVGQKVTGAFATGMNGWSKKYTWNPIGVVTREDRNRFWVWYDAFVGGMEWQYYYKDVGRIVFPHRM